MKTAQPNHYALCFVRHTCRMLVLMSTVLLSLEAVEQRTGQVSGGGGLSSAGTITQVGSITTLDHADLTIGTLRAAGGFIGQIRRLDLTGSPPLEAANMEMVVAAGGAVSGQIWYASTRALTSATIITAPTTGSIPGGVTLDGRFTYTAGTAPLDSFTVRLDNGLAQVQVTVSIRVLSTALNGPAPVLNAVNNSRGHDIIDGAWSFILTVNDPGSYRYEVLAGPAGATLESAGGAPLTPATITSAQSVRLRWPTPTASPQHVPVTIMVTNTTTGVHAFWFDLIRFSDIGGAG